MFGEFVKSIRTEKRIGLREFCIAASLDPSNWSKVERGLLPPPQNGAMLEIISEVLGFENDLEKVNQLVDYAAIDAGRIPEYVMKDRGLVRTLPIFFRNAVGRKPSRNELVKLAVILGKIK